MKVAFPLKNQRELAIDFGRCDSIGVFDNASNKLELLPYNASNELFDQISTKGVDCVVGPYFSCVSLQSFKANNIKVYKACSQCVEDNIKGLYSKVLKLFDIYDTVLVGECPKDCQGC